MLATVAVITYRSTARPGGNAEWVAKRHEFLDQLGTFELHLMEVDSAARGYLLAADEQYLPAYEQARRGLSQDMKVIEEPSGRRIPHGSPGYELARAAESSPCSRKRPPSSRRPSPPARRQGLDGAAHDAQRWPGRRCHQGIARSPRQTARQRGARLKTRSDLSAAIGRSSIAVVLMATVLSAVILTLAALLILRDIAVRRRAEEALAEEHNLLRGVMDAMPEQVFVTDRQGRFIIDNISHRRFLGVKLAREIEGKTAADFFPPTVANEMVKDNRVIMETGQPVLNQEDLVVRGDGQVVWIATTKVPLQRRRGPLHRAGRRQQRHLHPQGGRGATPPGRRATAPQQPRASGLRLHRLPRSPGAASQNPGLRRPPQDQMRRGAGRKRARLP